MITGITAQQMQAGGSTRRYIPLWNPGAESPTDMTGWTIEAGAFTNQTSTPHTGTRAYQTTSTGSAGGRRRPTVDAEVPAEYHAAVDAGGDTLTMSYWVRSSGSFAGTANARMRIYVYAADGTTLLASLTPAGRTAVGTLGVWIERVQSLAMPVGGRFVKLVYDASLNSGAGQVRDDDWLLWLE